MPRSFQYLSVSLDCARRADARPRDSNRGETIAIERGADSEQQSVVLLRRKLSAGCGIGFIDHLDRFWQQPQALGVQKVSDNPIGVVLDMIWVDSAMSDYAVAVAGAPNRGDLPKGQVQTDVQLVDLVMQSRIDNGMVIIRSFCDHRCKRHHRHEI